MNKLFLVCIVLGLTALNCKSIYDQKSYITPLNQINWKPQVDKIRQTTNFVSIVQFYKYDDGISKSFEPEFNKWVDTYRGVFRIGAVDCDESKAICDKEKITTFPTYKIYSPEPFSAIELTGEVNLQKLQQRAAKQLHSNVIEVTNTNLQVFLGESPVVPKVLLFTKQEKGTPMIYKGLSVTFEKKLFFGLVRSSDEILVQKYRVKKFPTLVIVQTGIKKNEVYTGEMNFQSIFKFINPYSQAFVPGGGSSQDSSATKQWLTEVVPELHDKSVNDVCYKVEGALCVVHIGQGKPEKTVMEVLKDLNVTYDRKIQRGSQFKFMWVDASVESKYAEALGYENKDKIIVLNPGKRKRFVAHEGDLSFDALKQTLEKIGGGDARFTRATLPTLTARKN